MGGPNIFSQLSYHSRCSDSRNNKNHSSCPTNITTRDRSVSLTCI